MQTGENINSIYVQQTEERSKTSPAFSLLDLVQRKVSERTCSISAVTLSKTLLHLGDPISALNPKAHRIKICKFLGPLDKALPFLRQFVQVLYLSEHHLRLLKVIFSIGNLDPTVPKCVEVDGVEKLYEDFLSFLLEKEQIAVVRQMLNRPSRAGAMLLLNITQKALGLPIQIRRQYLQNRTFHVVGFDARSSYYDRNFDREQSFSSWRRFREKLFNEFIRSPEKLPLGFVVWFFCNKRTKWLFFTDSSSSLQLQFNSDLPTHLVCRSSLTFPTLQKFPPLEFKYRFMCNHTEVYCQTFPNKEQVAKPKDITDKLVFTADLIQLRKVLNPWPQVRKSRLVTEILVCGHRAVSSSASLEVTRLIVASTVIQPGKLLSLEQQYLSTSFCCHPDHPEPKLSILIGQSKDPLIVKPVSVSPRSISFQIPDTHDSIMMSAKLEFPYEAFFERTQFYLARRDPCILNILPRDIWYIVVQYVCGMLRLESLSSSLTTSHVSHTITAVLPRRNPLPIAFHRALVAFYFHILRLLAQHQDAIPSLQVSCQKCKASHAVLVCRFCSSYRVCFSCARKAVVADRSHPLSHLIGMDTAPSAFLKNLLYPEPKKKK